jgi:hypothetical protein
MEEWKFYAVVKQPSLFENQNYIKAPFSRESCGKLTPFLQIYIFMC